jgi:DNA-binding transcriptional ArsR family regulator
MVKKVTIGKYSVLEPLLYSEEWKHLAEISRELKMPHVTARLHLNEFEHEGFVSKNKKGRLTMYKLNYHNNFLMNYVVLVEKEKLIRLSNANLILKEIVSFLLQQENKEIIIFGSSAVNIKEANDIDILMTGTIDKEAIKNFENKIDVKMHIINVKSLKEVNNALKIEIRNKHLIVKNSEEVIRWMLER